MRKLRIANKEAELIVDMDNALTQTKTKLILVLVEHTRSSDLVCSRDCKY